MEEREKERGMAAKNSVAVPPMQVVAHFPNSAVQPPPLPPQTKSLRQNVPQANQPIQESYQQSFNSAAVNAAVSDIFGDLEEYNKTVNN